MRHRIRIAGLALALFAAGAWYFVVRESPQAPATVAEAAQEPVTTGQAAASSSDAAARERDAALEPPTDAEPVESEAVPIVEEPPPETWTLWGFVRDEATDNPCANYRVLESSGIGALCNANGMFQMELDAVRAAPGKHRTFHVYSPDGARVATVRKQLEPGLVLLVDRVAVLYGRVVDPAGRPVPAEAVVIRAPHDDHVASVEVDARDGSFRAPVAARSVEYAGLVVHVELDGASYPLPCPTAELLRPEGATLVLDLCDVRFHVRLSDGAPADKASLNLIVRRANQRPQRLARARPDAGIFPAPFPLSAEGFVDVTLERRLSSVTVEVRQFGYAPWLEALPATPCGTVWEITLLKPGPDDVISGRVLSPDGEPLAGVLVSCLPTLADPEVSDAVMPWFSESTGEDGSFSVPFAQGKSAVLGASFRSYREIRGRAARGGDREVELRFDPLQRVVLDLIGPSGGPVRAGQEKSGFLLFLADGDKRTGMGTLHSIELEGVPVGRHRVCVSTDEPFLFGAVDVEVRAGSDVRLDVILRPAFSTTGQVVDAGGKPLVGARVRLLDAPWPQIGSELPFSTRSKADGWFRVFLADRPRAELELSYEGKAPVRVLVDADTPATWTVP